MNNNPKKPKNLDNVHHRTSPNIFGRAKSLHREMTPAERLLWSVLRGNKMHGVHFRNQHAIGNYIADFCAPRKKLIIELDGGQHLEKEMYDQERDKFLISRGYRVLRFWNKDVLEDINGVWMVIEAELNGG